MSTRKTVKRTMHGLLITACFIVSGIDNTTAQSNTSIWFYGTPEIKKQHDLPNIDAKNQYCEQTKISVLRKVASSLRQVDEDHCMVPTSYGQISSDAKVIQPLGQSVAYPLVTGTRKIIPIPHHPGAIQNITATYSNGSVMGIYKNFFGSLELKMLGGLRYELNEEPDERLKGYAGGYRRLNIRDTLRFSNSGQVMVVEDKTAGFIKMNLTTYTITPYHYSTVTTSSGALLPASTAISEDGVAFNAYFAPQNWGSRFIEIIDTNDCAPSPEINDSRVRFYPCRHRDFMPEITHAIPDLIKITNSKFINDRTISFEAWSGAAPNYKYAKYTMTAPGEKLRLVDYLAMGDSYASGQGAGNYREGTDTSRNRCHQSTLSYSYMFSSIFRSPVSVACSGAKLVNVYRMGDRREEVDQLSFSEPSDLDNYNALTGYIPGYIEQIGFLANYPEVVTISVGGNDIKFADHLQKCVQPWKTGNSGTCFATYEDRAELVKVINDRLPRLRSTYKEIRKDDPERRLYVIGYPQVAKHDGDCGVNVQMNKAELLAAEQLINYLNKVIREAASQAGAYYVDVEDAFDGYRLCENKTSRVAVNGVTTRFDQGKTIEFTESFHPNARGHELLADAIRKQTKNFTTPMPPPATETSKLPIDDRIAFLRDAPKGNRPINDVKYEDSPLFPEFKDEVNELYILGQSHSLKPQHEFEAVLHSTPIQLGSFTTDTEGNLKVEYTVPAHVEPGFHTLHLYGKDIYDNDIDIQKTVYVAESRTDIDGDGIKDASDTCEAVRNSGQDADGDGVDDACDGYVGEPQVSANSIVNSVQNRASEIAGLYVQRATSSLGEVKGLQNTPATDHAPIVGFAATNQAAIAATKNHRKLHLIVGSGIVAVALCFAWMKYRRNLSKLNDS